MPVVSIPDLQRTIKLKDTKLQQQEVKLKEYEKQIQELKNKIDQLQIALNHSQPSFTEPSVDRRAGISAEVNAQRTSDEEVTFKHHPKETRTKELINQAIQNNEFMKNLEATQIQEIVECMQPTEVAKDHFIIKEGTVGSLFYVIEDGSAEVTRGGKPLTVLGAGKLFGELAILYNCTRSATVRATLKCRLWTLERQVFQKIMMCTGMKLQKQYVTFLQSIPAFKTKPLDQLSRIADVLEMVHYDNGRYIIRQGAPGDTFYIIAKGKVNVTQCELGSTEEKQVNSLKVGECFGERALETEDVRTANIIADDPDGVDCLVLERDAYKQLIKRLLPDVPEEPIDQPKTPETKTSVEDNAVASSKLSDLKRVTTLGIGGFGRVDLVYIGKDNTRSFALKQLKKKHVEQTKQQDHVMNEKKIMRECRNCDFVVRLYKTFRDKDHLYFLTDACLGGELWTRLRDKLCFDDSATRFFVGCVTEAFTFLHSRGIAYRDLKPENLLLDKDGYIKLVDFGFAKHVSVGKKTWTFCGTPEYVAPEIILNKGHDLSVDLWSLGILIFELLTGSPPFSGADHMKTYNLILKGIDFITFPTKISRPAQQIIRKLCRDNASERLGYGTQGLKEVQKQKWFDGFNWEGLRKRRIEVPIKPQVKSALDKSNFDNFPDSPLVIAAPDDETGWDKDF